MPPASPPATLHYEPPNTNLSSEMAAVWRVAWWIGVLWSIGTILATSHTVWTLVSGGWAESRLATLRFGGLFAGLSLTLCAGAVALLGALLARTRRQNIAIVTMTMSFLLLLWQISRLLVGGIYFEQSFHLVWLSTIVLRMLLDGAIVVVAMAAWWPRWMTPSRFFAAVAMLVLGWPAGQLLDLLYWWLARGESVRQVLRDQFSWQMWPMTAQASLFLLVGTLLIVMSSALQRRRWLLWLVVIVAILGINLWDLVNLLRAFDVFWANEPFWGCLQMIARNLQGVAPALGLLAWRPPARPT